ncbi:MAG: Sec-independent protein translocase protein TatB [Burkholderiaceae bacterium]|nr:Sec-independent protein translocase protein TatB [Burkholderiaceae bacterium]
MFDFSIGELGVIGAVALIVLGPERLPKVARQVGDWVGKAQRYVSQVKSDINRELELSELKKLQEEARNAASMIGIGLVRTAVRRWTAATFELTSLGSPAPGSESSAATDYAWEGAGESWERRTFARRYKPGPSVDELAEEIARLKRELAMPDSHAASRRKYAPRARINRARIRR